MAPASESLERGKKHKTAPEEQKQTLDKWRCG